VRKVFISYARQNKTDIEQLVEHLRVLGCDTWHDSSLHGGEDWWEEILRRIADCDTFIAIISREALDSTACRREFDWAESLDKPVLPVAVEPLPKALPRRLSKRQIVDYSVREDRDRAALTLAGGLATLPAAPPLPDHLPEPPAAPLSYLTDLIDLVTEGKALDHDQQRHILNQLEPALYSVDPEERQGGHDILEMLSGRDDLYADVYRTINRLKEMGDAPSSIRSSDQISTEPSSVAVAAEPFTSTPNTVLGDDVPLREKTTQHPVQSDVISASAQTQTAPVHEVSDESGDSKPEPSQGLSAPDAGISSTPVARGGTKATEPPTSVRDRPEADTESAQHQPGGASEDSGPASSPNTDIAPADDGSDSRELGSITVEDRGITSVLPPEPTTTPVEGSFFFQRLNRRTKIVLGAGALLVVVVVTLVVVVSRSGSRPSSSVAQPSPSDSVAQPSPSDSKVLIDGQELFAQGSVVCTTNGSNLEISIGDGVGAQLSAGNTPTVKSVQLGNVQGAVLAYTEGEGGSGGAQATKDGKTYKITGTATGVDMSNPMAGPVSRSFEIDVTCA
jgi:hypothetical protein